MKRKILFLVTAIMLISWAVPAKAEIDTNLILWRSDSCMFKEYRVHPNGNIIARQYSKFYEIDGSTGHIIRRFAHRLDTLDDVQTFEISRDGKYFAYAFDSAFIIDYSADTIIKKFRTYAGAFSHDSKKYVFANMTPTGNGKYVNHDSLHVIYNFETGEYRYFGPEEGIFDYNYFPYLFTSDGKYILMGLSTSYPINMNWKYAFELWYADSLKIARVLDKDSMINETDRIYISPNSKIACFLSNYYLHLYNLETKTKIKMIKEQKYHENSFCFINDSIICYCTNIGGIVRIDIQNLNTEEQLFQYFGYFGEIGYNPHNNTLLLRDNGGIIALKYSELLTNAANGQTLKQIDASYQNGNLVIQSEFETNDFLKIKIYDLKGNLIKTLESESENSSDKISIPLSINQGVYIVRVSQNNKQYQSKLLISK